MGAVIPCCDHAGRDCNSEVPRVATRSLDEQRKAFAAEHGRKHAPPSLSNEEYAECVRLAAKARTRTGDPVRIDPATLPQPKSQAKVKAELRRQKKNRDILQVLQPSGRLKTYRMKSDGCFHHVPPRRSHGDVVGVVIPRRKAATSPRRRRSRATARAGSSRDGPGLGDPDEPPDLEHLRPLGAVARAYLRAEVDRRRREAVAARREVRLFDEDGAA
jgi:hypothetical protein